MRWMKFAGLLALTVVVSLPASGSAPGGVMGDWIGPTQVVVRIYHCDGAVCAKIVKLSPDSPDKMDGNNPESSLRKRPLCGLDIGTGFKQVDAAHLADGHLYDPKNGKTYSGTIFSDGDKLNLHGYIGISLLGRTEVWHRIAMTDASRCQ